MLWLLASLMMTPVEEAQVVPLLDSGHEAVQAKTTMATSDCSIHLSGLVYTSPDEWVVWLNGNKMRPQSLSGDGFHIQNVDATTVTIALNDHPNKAFTLSPGEHLNLDNGQVVDAVATNHRISEPASKNIVAAEGDLSSLTNG